VTHEEVGDNAVWQKVVGVRRQVDGLVELYKGVTSAVDCCQVHL